MRASCPCPYGQVKFLRRWPRPSSAACPSVDDGALSPAEVLVIVTPGLLRRVFVANSRPPRRRDRYP